MGRCYIQYPVAAILFFILVLFCSSAFGEVSQTTGSGAVGEAPGETAGEFDDLTDFPEEEPISIDDPFEPLNRIVFTFNDRLYFLVLKPVARIYSRLVPEDARIGVRRFFLNVATPVRFVNALLQFKIHDAGNELSRFLINTTIGLGGFLDPATDKYRIFRHKEDTGQTLGFYGAGPVFYMNLPFFGPSSLRDTVGLAGDSLLDPVTYLFPHDRIVSVGVRVYDRAVNETSLNIGVYEGIKNDALDPYIFIRDAYHQHRENMIQE